MIPKKLQTILIFFLILCCLGTNMVVSEKISKNSLTSDIKNFSASQDLIKKAFLFGKVKNVTSSPEFSTFEPINLRILFLQPIQFFHVINGVPITFVNQERGIIGGGRFVFGSFQVVLPITSNRLAVMNTTMGTIILEIYEDKMPNTSANFIRLVNDGFYDGLVFHRVIDDFVIQGGGYYSNGTEKESPYGPIDLEINPEVHHLDGTIGMARTSDPNSATSQFFIDDGAQRFLEPGGSDPNGYAAFGRVVVGIDVVRTIASVETMTKYGNMDDWPVNDIIIESITIVGPT